MRAMLLCAGEGRRLRPLTQLYPKPLTTIGGVPLAVRQILALKRAGITEIVVNAAYGARILQAELGDGSRWGVHLAWSVEGHTAAEALETRGGIVRALPLLMAGSEDGAFIVAAGDIATDYDYAALAEQAQSLSASGDWAHLVMVANPTFHPQGDFRLVNGRIARRDAVGGEILTYASLAAFHPQLFAGLHADRAPLFPWMFEALDAGRVSGEKLVGRWATSERSKSLHVPKICLQLRGGVKIGPHEFKFPLMLAPMAGYSDRPFREIVREWGADYAVAEMTASREDLRCRAKSLTRWVEQDEPGLHVVQLLSADPVVMAEAAKAAEDDGADVVDINMGCPAKRF